MTLGDLNLNKSGGDLYSQQRNRIMREGEEQKKRLEHAETDRMERMLIQKKADKHSLVLKIDSLKREISRAGVSSKSDADYRRDVTEKERRIRLLEGDERRLNEEISRSESEISRRRNSQKFSGRGLF